MPKNVSRVRTEYGDVVLDETSGRYYHLNGSAALALELFENDHTHDDAVLRFTEVFGVDRDSASEDLAAARRRLVAIGLLS